MNNIPRINIENSPNAQFLALIFNAFDGEMWHGIKRLI
jgi:hypothetical protein